MLTEKVAIRSKTGSKGVVHVFEREFKAIWLISGDRGPSNLAWWGD